MTVRQVLGLLLLLLPLWIYLTARAKEIPWAEFGYGLLGMLLIGAWFVASMYLMFGDTP